MKENERLTGISDYLDPVNYYVDEMGVGLAKDNAEYELSCREYCEIQKGNCMGCAIQKAFNRLGEYENTGLSPEEVEKLKAAASKFSKELDLS